MGFQNIMPYKKALRTMLYFFYQRFFVIEDIGINFVQRLAHSLCLRAIFPSMIVFAKEILPFSFEKIR
jgi:hypothetical protein